MTTVCIISVVLFIDSRLVTNIIHDTQETSEDMSLVHVKKSANIYVKENPNEVIWQDSETGTYSCVKLQTLINKVFLKETITQDTNLKSNTYIIVKKMSKVIFFLRSLITMELAFQREVVPSFIQVMKEIMVGIKL